ncbi:MULTISPECIES: hypothetical protein [unclassified Prochlorococcus]|uniref:hypothetical protein n=1 Tax=unclassified Prochlorococcus TaxID=2627481 RepID=UPI0005337822|nr:MULTISPECIES: hypothetical protein [unclassified Prochlorococcus]KGG16143.1 hypothetical protein EV06_0853 [Prochlorococcus sp. MIT 0602]KGG17262.1 hypothetical protein EV07_0700 [Prochlorococcus sp. MIT 0603]
MDYFLPKAYLLIARVSTTSLTIWAMIVFLAVLVGALGFAVVKELKSRSQALPPRHEEKGPKGF